MKHNSRNSGKGRDMVRQSQQKQAAEDTGGQDIYSDIVPAFHCYMDYKSGNYGGHCLCFTDANGRSWYFSYKTLVAFNTRATGLVCLKNYWSSTTGKHLNAIQPDHGKRVDQKTFDALLLLARTSNLSIERPNRGTINYLDAAGALVSGFDYKLQLWVKNYIIQACGHRPEHACNCTARICAGQDIREVKRAFIATGRI